MIAESIQNWLEQHGYRVRRTTLSYEEMLTIYHQHYSAGFAPISYLYVTHDGIISFGHTRVLASDPTLFQQLTKRYDPPI